MSDTFLITIFKKAFSWNGWIRGVFWFQKGVDINLGRTEKSFLRRHTPSFKNRYSINYLILIGYNLEKIIKVVDENYFYDILYIKTDFNFIF